MFVFLYVSILNGLTTFVNISCYHFPITRKPLFWCCRKSPVTTWPTIRSQETMESTSGPRTTAWDAARPTPGHEPRRSFWKMSAHKQVSVWTLLFNYNADGGPIEYNTHGGPIEYNTHGGPIDYLLLVSNQDDHSERCQRTNRYVYEHYCLIITQMVGPLNITHMLGPLNITHMVGPLNITHMLGPLTTNSWFRTKTIILKDVSAQTGECMNIIV